MLVIEILCKDTTKIAYMQIYFSFFYVFSFAEYQNTCFYTFIG